MAQFCHIFPGLSPAAFWNLELPEYFALRRFIEAQREANQPTTHKSLVTAMAASGGPSG